MEHVLLCTIFVQHRSYLAAFPHEQSMAAVWSCRSAGLLPHKRGVYFPYVVHRTAQCSSFIFTGFLSDTSAHCTVKLKAWWPPCDPNIWAKACYVLISKRIQVHGVNALLTTLAQEKEAVVRLVRIAMTKHRPIEHFWERKEWKARRRLDTTEVWSNVLGHSEHRKTKKTHASLKIQSFGTSNHSLRHPGRLTNIWSEGMKIVN